jgi:hypothetical protein
VVVFLATHSRVSAMATSTTGEAEALTEEALKKLKV